MVQEKLRISIEVEQGGNLDITIREILQSYLDGSGSDETGELATDKQKELMDKNKISYDEFTTKTEASGKISSFFDKKKK